MDEHTIHLIITYIAIAIGLLNFGSAAVSAANFTVDMGYLPSTKTVEGKLYVGSWVALVAIIIVAAIFN